MQSRRHSQSSEYREGEERISTLGLNTILGHPKTRDLKLCIGQWCALPNSPEEMEEYDLWVEQGNNPCKMSYTQIFNEGLAWARDGLPPEEEPEG